MTAKQISKTVLLVDDDDQVRRLCRIFLEHAGYHVIEADAPAQAEVVWSDNSQDILLLVTDHDMPGKNGLQLSATLRTDNPALPVLLISGIPQLVPDSVRFLQKPFSRSEFLGLVEHCISNRLR